MRGKPAGASPWSHEQRAIRRGVIEAGAIRRGELLADAKRKAGEQALEELRALGGVRDLDPLAYKRARRQATALCRRALDPRP
jgi:hypothetical protein